MGCCFSKNRKSPVKKPNLKTVPQNKQTINKNIVNDVKQTIEYPESVRIIYDNDIIGEKKNCW